MPARPLVVLCLCLCLALAVPVAAVAATDVATAAEPDCGTVEHQRAFDGTYLVASLAQLQCIEGEDLLNDFRLTRDIDASETSDWNNGTGFEPIGPTFRGGFDGDGHSITGLVVDRPGSSEVGLFEATGSSARLRDVALVDAEVAGGNSTGGLVGVNGGVVNDSYTTGVVRAPGGDDVGGLAGRNGDGASIVRSYSETEVRGGVRVGRLVGRNVGGIRLSYAVGSVDAKGDAGGLAGRNAGTVRDSYARVRVSGETTIGGLVGHNFGFGEVIGSYAAGDVEIARESGGLVGYDTATVEGSYFDGELLGGERRAGGDTSGTPLDTDEMRGDAAPGNMTALDFGDTWVPTDGYPVLAWQTRDTGSGVPRDGSGGGTAGDGDTPTGGEDETETGTDTDPATDGEGTTPTDDTDAETDRETDGEADTGDSVEEDGEAQPGFGFAGTVVALVVVSLSLRYRDR